MSGTLGNGWKAGHFKNTGNVREAREVGIWGISERLGTPQGGWVCQLLERLGMSVLSAALEPSSPSRTGVGKAPGSSMSSSSSSSSEESHKQALECEGVTVAWHLGVSGELGNIMGWAVAGPEEAKRCQGGLPPESQATPTQAWSPKDIGRGRLGSPPDPGGLFGSGAPGFLQ